MRLWRSAGDEVRATWFRRAQGGYDVSQVDALLSQIAGEVDAGRSPAALIESAEFGRARGFGYDVEAVDWFLGQLCHQGDDRDPGPLSADSWRDLGMVAQLSAASGPQGAAASLRRGGDGWGIENWEELSAAWERFSELPGVRLHCGLGLTGFLRAEVTPEEHQPLATWRRYPAGQTNDSDRLLGARVRGQRYRRRKVGRAEPAYAALEARSWQDLAGRYADAATFMRGFGLPSWSLRAFHDETGTPVLYVTGENLDHQARARITFADQRSLRFLVRGTTPENAIMTAVDDSGECVARYRRNSRKLPTLQRTLDITVNPSWPLTDELVLALAVSAQWLGTYFAKPGGVG